MQICLGASTERSIPCPHCLDALGLCARTPRVLYHASKSAVLVNMGYKPGTFTIYNTSMASSACQTNLAACPSSLKSISFGVMRDPEKEKKKLAD